MPRVTPYPSSPSPYIRTSIISLLRCRSRSVTISGAGSRFIIYSPVILLWRAGLMLRCGLHCRYLSIILLSLMSMLSLSLSRAHGIFALIYSYSAVNLVEVDLYISVLFLWT
ncbi:hypothetical protein BDW69DRAFT_162442 [Aspergillus filifer]